MTEVLYDIVNNQIYLFEGNFEIDNKSKRITIVLVSGKKLYKTPKVKIGQLVHIGWL